MRRAVFLDRDGVLNALVVDPDQGWIDSPLHPRQLRMLPRAGKAVRLLNKAGLLVIVASNQPAVAKGKMLLSTLEAITNRLLKMVSLAGGRVDDVQYCLHHPQAKQKAFQRRCHCRKPAPGLLRAAARKWNIDLKRSYMVGDGVNDILAGRRASCRTLWVGDLRCEFCRASRHQAKPHYVVGDIWEAAQLIQRLEAK